MLYFFKLIALSFLPFVNVSAQDADELSEIALYIEQCKDIQSRFEKDYKTSCFTNYSHFSYSSKVKYNKNLAQNLGNVKIAHFNLLHPGMAKTKFKDFKIVASIINQWDVLAATELLPLMSDDIKHNSMIKIFIDEQVPKEIEKYNLKIKEEKKKKKPTLENVTKYQAAIKKLKSDQLFAKSLFRKPGYLKILDELHKLPQGKSWSLLLTSRGDAAKEKDVQELVGYFYRSNIVKPQTNKFCDLIDINNKDSNSFACIVPMTERWHGKDFRPHISRRPFMASFQSGKFQFTLLAAHVVFTSKEDNADIAKLFFDNKTIPGVNKQNHDRVAEVKASLEFMNILNEKYKMKNLIYTGDFNLEMREKFWPSILTEFPGAQVYISEPTSVSENKLRSNGEPTSGVASNYDHFIFRPEDLSRCLTQDSKLNGGVFSFYTLEGDLPKLIFPYIIREDETIESSEIKDKANIIVRYIESLKGTHQLPYVMNISHKNFMDDLMIPQVDEDKEIIEKLTQEFENRVLDSQLENKTYYKVYSQLISDHLPVHMTCSNSE